VSLPRISELLVRVDSWGKDLSERSSGDMSTIGKLMSSTLPPRRELSRGRVWLSGRESPFFIVVKTGVDLRPMLA
jgi:hypothetical protein